MEAILRPFEDLISFLLSNIYEYIPNVGIAIIVVTMLVMLLVFPLTHKQTKSMLAMQALQPQMKELQEKYKDDRTKLSEETMKLYKEAGVNPLGGCLPLLVQMPFFFAIFRVTTNIPKYVDESTRLFQNICSPAKTYEICTSNAAGLVEAGFDRSVAEAEAARLPEGKEFFGLQLSKSLFRLIDDGGLTPSILAAYLILIILIAFAAYVSISRSQSLNPNASQQMKFLKYVMPFAVSISPIILPAGANLYILTSSTWRAVQQEFLYRKIIIPHHEKQKTPEKTKELEKDNPGPIENYEAGKARKKRKKK